MAISERRQPSPRRCLVVQHVAPEGPYGVASALEQAGVQVEVCQVFADEQLPGRLDGLSGLVVMGGPMSAGPAVGFPTRDAEVRLLASAIDLELPVLGVCLGAQLLAASAGAAVYAGGAGPEIGWAPVTLTAGAVADPLFHGLPARFEPLHWHGDTFGLPRSSVHLAFSSMYANQAFRVGPAAWGLQFHLEVDKAAVSTFVGAFAQEAEAAGVAPGTLAERAAAYLEALAPVREGVLGRFAALVADRPALSRPRQAEAH